MMPMQPNVGTHAFGFEPFIVGNFAHWVESHLTVGNQTKEMGAIVGAEGYEIQAILGIIVPTQPDGSAVMNGSIEFYQCWVTDDFPHIMPPKLQC
jgi:hypothetical protein